MDNTEAGSSDPAQDQSGAPGGDPVANQETTRTIKVRLEPRTDNQRLDYYRLGHTGPVYVELPLDAPGLNGVDEQGYGLLYTDHRDGESSAQATAQDAIAKGKDVLTALREMAEAREAYRAKKEAEHKAHLVAERAREDRCVEAQKLRDGLVVPDNVRIEHIRGGYYRDEIEVDIRGLTYLFGLCQSRDLPAHPSVEQVQAEIDRISGEEEAAKTKAALKREAEEAAKASKAAERDAWITEHGSDGLKDRVARGYNCQRRYMEERLAAELPGWTIEKWDEEPSWNLRDRACPSDTALVLEDEAKAAGFEARTHWAIWEAAPDNYDEREGRSAEVVVVEDFHGYLIYHRTS